MKNLFLLLLCITTICEASYKTRHYHHRHAKGLKRTFNSKEFVRRSRKMILPRLSLPKRVDLTSRVSPPEDQGQCGSCWDFSITKALRSAWMLSGNDPGRLAFNYLLDNCGTGPSQSGCDGGDFDAGQSFLDGGGPWLESQDPYQQRQTSCRNLPTVATSIAYLQVGNGSQAPTFEELAYALSQQHMLVVDVAACTEWENYASGIFDKNECGRDQINHMVNLVSYDCETSVDANGNCAFINGQPKNGDGYLVVMNQWGYLWGENGFMRSRWGINALADTAMYFDVPPSPPSPIPPGPPPSPCWWHRLRRWLGL